MHLPSRLSCASRSVTVDQEPIGVLHCAIAGTESLPRRCALMRNLNRKPVHARVYNQALLPSSSFIARKSVAGVAVGHSSFRSEISLGRRLQISNGTRWSAVWLDNTAKVEADISLSVAWDLWNDREGVSRWMPWIDNVKPIHHQKIHWRSVDGLPNRGTVRFYPRGPTSCGVQLTISYEVPEVLGGLGVGVAPNIDSILQQDLDRFAKFAKAHQLECQRK